MQSEIPIAPKTSMNTKLIKKTVIASLFTVLAFSIPFIGQAGESPASTTSEKVVVVLRAQVIEEVAPNGSRMVPRVATTVEVIRLPNAMIATLFDGEKKTKENEFASVSENGKAREFPARLLSETLCAEIGKIKQNNLGCLLDSTRLQEFSGETARQNAGSDGAGKKVEIRGLVGTDRSTMDIFLNAAWKFLKNEEYSVRNAIQVQNGQSVCLGVFDSWPSQIKAPAPAR
jgi:hypothetical protein